MSDEVVEGRERRDPRRFVYAAFDALFAVVYVIILSAAPSRHLADRLLLWTMVGSVVAMALGMLLGSPWGRRAAAIGCGLLLVCEAILLGLLVASAAFLAGVYGSLGQGGAIIALLIGFLSFQMIALLPALQLRYLLGAAGRRAFGVS